MLVTTCAFFLPPSIAFWFARRTKQPCSWLSILVKSMFPCTSEERKARVKRRSNFTKCTRRPNFCNDLTTYRCARTGQLTQKCCCRFVLPDLQSILLRRYRRCSCCRRYPDDSCGESPVCGEIDSSRTWWKVCEDSFLLLWAG